MKNSISTFLFIFAVVALSACGGSSGNASAGAAAGIYKGSGEKMTKANATYFFITANSDVYLLQKDQSQFRRNYQANLADMSYTFDNGTFTSGDLTGTRMAGNESELSDQLKTLVQVNKSAVSLMSVLNGAKLNLQFRLEATNPGFTAQQQLIVDSWTANSAVLIKYMQDKKLDSLWINDYTNTNLYTKNGHLNLPAGIGSLSATDANSNLQNAANIDEY